MSDRDDQSFEKMLRAVPTRRPSAELDARIRSSIAGRSRPHLSRWAVAAAVTVAVLGLFERGLIHSTVRQIAPPVVAITTADFTTRLTCDTAGGSDAAVVVADNTPYNVIHQTTVHEVIWIDPRTHARLVVRTPVEQVIISKAEVF